MNPNYPIYCDQCDEIFRYDESIADYVKHLAVCPKNKKPEVKVIDDYECIGYEPRHYPMPYTLSGLTQTFAMYYRPYSQTHYDTRKIVKLTRIGGMVSLAMFYDYGRLPVHKGWGNGRVMWVAERGSKWINFRSWNSYRWQVFDRDNGKCQMCGKIVGEKETEGRYAGLWKNDAVFVCDHKIPLCRGGKDWHEDPEMTNFQTLCKDCNKVKTKQDMGALAIERQTEKENKEITHFVKVNRSILEFVDYASPSYDDKKS